MRDAREIKIKDRQVKEVEESNHLGKGTTYSIVGINVHCSLECLQSFHSILQAKEGVSFTNVPLH